MNTEYSSIELAGIVEQFAAEVIENGGSVGAFGIEEESAHYAQRLASKIRLGLELTDAEIETFEEWIGLVPEHAFETLHEIDAAVLPSEREATDRERLEELEADQLDAYFAGHDVGFDAEGSER